MIKFQENIFYKHFSEKTFDIFAVLEFNLIRNSKMKAREPSARLHPKKTDHEQSLL